MYVERIPNRNSNPTWLLRQSTWKNGKSVKTTLSNLTKVPHELRMQFREVCRGGIVVRDVLGYFKEVYLSAQSAPHGHVAATLGTLRKLKLDQLISSRTTRVRNIVLALIVSRILNPGSKYATASALREEDQTSSLGGELALENVHENEIYQAMDWLYKRKDAIEQELAARHLKEGSVVLCDVTSTYVVGHGADLAEFGYSRDKKKGTKQINFGLLCDKEGRPVGVEVFSGNTADPATLTAQLQKLKERFGLSRVTIVGDRGLLTHARLTEEVQPAGYDWITGLRKGAIRRLVQKEDLQLTLFDEMDLAEITSDDYPGERLIVCRNPLMAERARNKREALLQATEKKLDALVAATVRKRRPLRGTDKIALRAGAILGRYKMQKHIKTVISDDAFSYQRDEASIAQEASLDGMYAIRTNVKKDVLASEEAVASYKQLAVVEKAFRSFKTVDLKVRPIYHYRARRIKSHIFLCMLAYYVQWHMKDKLAPMLFAEEDLAAAKAARASVVAPAEPSPEAQSKARTKKTSDGARATSFQSLMSHLAQLGKFKLVEKNKPEETVRLVLQTLSPKQKKAFRLLGVSHH